MTSPGPVLSRNVLDLAMLMFLPQRWYHHNLWSTYGLTGLRSDCLGLDRDSPHLGTLSTILQHFAHTMKPCDPLLLALYTWNTGVYCTGYTFIPANCKSKDLFREDFFWSNFFWKVFLLRRFRSWGLFLLMNMSRPQYKWSLKSPKTYLTTF